MQDKMFFGTKTWNPFTGCDHGCPYCWFFHKTLPRVSGFPKYRNGGVPTVHHYLVKQGPPKYSEPNLFVVDCGDAFCKSFKTEDIIALLDSCHISSLVKNFLLLTKNPPRYLEIAEKRPDLVMDGRFVWGATIETTWPRVGIYHTQLAPHAPEPWHRAEAMMEFRQKYPNTRMFLSLEPIMDFDLDKMLTWIEKIKPEFIYVGYDSLKKVNPQVEPDLEKVKLLMFHAKTFTKVNPKLLRERRV